MNSKLRSVAHLSLLPLVVSLAPMRLVAETLDFEFQAGQTEVATRKFQEIGKRGYALGLMGLKYFSLPVGNLGLGLGAFTSKVEGKKASRGITQDLSVTLLTIDLRYLYEAFDSFSFGPVLRGSFGRGAKYSVQQNDDVDLLFSPGVMLRYAFKEMPYAPSLHFLYTHDANVAKRDIQTYLLGVSISTNLGDQKSTAPFVPVETPSPVAPAEPAADPAPSPAPAPTQPEVIEIPDVPETTQTTPPVPGDGKGPEPILFRFAPNSTRLNGISREKAKALAKILSENPDSWSMVGITGHSDRSGDPKQNIELSRKRTEAFCELLSKRGIPRKKMNCKAMDFQELLPGLPENAEEHRRIEVRFENVDPAQADALKQMVEKTLQL